MARRCGRSTWQIFVCIALVCALCVHVRGAPAPAPLDAHVDEHAQMIKEMNNMIGKMEATLSNVRSAFKAKEAELKVATGHHNKDVQRLKTEKDELQVAFDRTSKQVKDLQASVRRMEQDWQKSQEDLGKAREEKKKEQQARESVARELAKTQAEFQAVHEKLAKSSISSVWLVTAEEMSEEIGIFLESPRTAKFLKVSVAKLAALTAEMNELVQSKMGAKNHGVVIRTLLTLLTFGVPIYLTFYFVSRAGKVFEARQQALIVLFVFMSLCLTFFIAALVLQSDPFVVLQANADDMDLAVTLILLCVALAVLVSLLLLVRAMLSTSLFEERVSYMVQIITFITLAVTWRSMFWVPLMKSALYRPPHPVLYAIFAGVFVAMMVLTLKAKQMQAFSSASSD